MASSSLKYHSTDLRFLHSVTRSKNPTKIRSKRISFITSSAISGGKLRAAVIGGGPAGSSAAAALASGGVETFLLERSLTNAKPCGGAIPLCMLDEFDIPLTIVDRQVREMRIISPSNRVVDFGKTLKPHEFIAMCRREVLDSFLRSRAEKSGATIISALMTHLDSRTTVHGALYY